MLIDDVHKVYDIPEYIRKMWGDDRDNPLVVLEANGRYMYEYGQKLGLRDAKDDSTILRMYAKDVVQACEARVFEHGFSINCVAGFCDLFRKAYVETYEDYVKNHPIRCEYCGQELPPKEPADANVS